MKILLQNLKICFIPFTKWSTAQCLRECYVPHGYELGAQEGNFVYVIKAEMEEKRVDNKKIVGFGSDGARVMTGTELGVTGFMLREVNPLLSNIHCVAHKLALRSAQAAEKVPF